MASYKVPQDVEAEDKFLGPLTFKQFLFGGGFVISGFIMFQLIVRGFAPISIIFLPFFLVFGALAFPWGKDQPTEVWLAGRFRYMFFPRKRIWDQTGAKELVTVTVPKREEKIYSDGLEQTEVKSRLTALADVVDSRGWAVKHAGIKRPGSDRLLNGTSVKSSKDQSAGNQTDIFDNTNNPLAGQFDNLIKKSEDSRRQATLSMIDDALHEADDTPTEPTGPSLPQVAKESAVKETPAKKSRKKSKKKDDNAWYIDQPTPDVDQKLATMKKAESISPQTAPQKDEKETTTRDEQVFLDRVHKKQKDDSLVSKNLDTTTLQPTSSITTSDDDTDDNSQADENASAAPVDPGILTLAHNDDLNIETIARESHKNDEDQEIVVELHK